MSTRRGNKSKGGYSSDNIKKVSMHEKPPNHPQENIPAHVTFLARSLTRNDEDMSTLVDLNRTLHLVRQNIIDAMGEESLLDLGEGMFQLTPDGRDIMVSFPPKEELESFETDAERAAFVGQRQKQLQRKMPQEEAHRDLCVDFLLRMKLRRRLLNRLARRMMRVAHAMDGEDVSAPVPPKYGDLPLDLTPEDLEESKEKWQQQEEARKKIAEFRQQHPESLVPLVKVVKSEDNRTPDDDDSEEHDDSDEEEEDDDDAESKENDEESSSEEEEEEDDDDEEEEEEEEQDDDDDDSQLEKESKDDSESEEEEIVKSDEKELSEDSEDLFGEKEKADEKVEKSLASLEAEVGKEKNDTEAAHDDVKMEDAEETTKDVELEDVKDEPKPQPTDSKDSTEDSDSDMFASDVGGEPNEGTSREKTKDEASKPDEEAAETCTDQTTKLGSETIEGSADKAAAASGEKAKDEAMEDATEPAEEEKDDSTGKETASGEAEKDQSKDETPKLAVEVKDDSMDEATALDEDMKEKSTGESKDVITTPGVEGEAMEAEPTKSGEEAQEDSEAKATKPGSGLKEGSKREELGEDAKTESKERSMDESATMDSKGAATKDSNGAEGDTPTPTKEENETVEQKESLPVTKGGKAEETAAAASTSQKENEGDSAHAKEPEKAPDDKNGDSRNDAALEVEKSELNGRIKEADAATESVMVDKVDGGVEEADTVAPKIDSSEQFESADDKGTQDSTNKPEKKCEEKVGDEKKAIVVGKTPSMVDREERSEITDKEAEKEAESFDDTSKDDMEVENVESSQFAGVKSSPAADETAEAPVQRPVKSEDILLVGAQEGPTQAGTSEKPEEPKAPEGTSKVAENGSNKSPVQKSLLQVPETKELSGIENDFELLKEYVDAYQKDVDPNTGAVSFSILNESHEDDYVVLDERPGVGARSRMNLKEKEIEFQRWQSSILSQIPEAPTLDEIGMKNCVFMLDERRKRLQELKEEMEMKSLKKRKRSVSPSKRRDSDRSIGAVEKKSPNKKGNEDEGSEENRKTKRMKPLPLVPFPSFYESDLRRARIVHFSLMAESIKNTTKHRLKDAEKEYENAYKHSTSLFERKKQYEENLKKVVGHYQAQAAKITQDYTVTLEVEQSRWQRRKAEYDANRLRKLMPSNWNTAPVGTSVTQAVVSKYREGTHPHIVGTCVADLVDAVVIKATNDIKDAPFEDFQPPPKPDLNSLVVDQATGETFVQHYQRQQRRYQQEIQALTVKLNAAEEDRKRAWKKMLKVRAEFQDPSSQSLAVLNNTGQQAPSQQGGGAATARANDRVLPDGSIEPPNRKKGSDGLYLRPAGRGRKGCTWNAVQGVWVPRN